MDKAADSGSADAGSIPVRDTKTCPAQKEKIRKHKLPLLQAEVHSLFSYFLFLLKFKRKQLCGIKTTKNNI